MNIFIQIHPVSGNLLPQTFEALTKILVNIPGMFFEMDGSFVWVDHDVKPTTQMDGMVYDREEKLAYIEIKGACSAMQWHRLCLAACGLVTPTSLDPLSSEGESHYGAIDRIARIHRVAEGDWTTASAIADQL